MLMNLYMTPGSCTTGIHILLETLLEEFDLIFQVTVVNLMEGDQHKPEFLAINPKATIPVLVRTDGSALTDFQAIAWWLAKEYPKACLLPTDVDGEIKVLEIMNYIVGTLHMQGFARIFTVDKFTLNENDYEWVKRQGRDIVDKGFLYIDSQLSDEGFVTELFSIADAALFYVEFWADRIGIELPDRCRAHYEKMIQRSAVKQVLSEEGYRV